MRALPWVLSFLGTLEEVGGTREESLWGQDVLPLSSGQNPDTSDCFDFRPSGNCLSRIWWPPSLWA